MFAAAAPGKSNAAAINVAKVSRCGHRNPKVPPSHRFHVVVVIRRPCRQPAATGQHAAPGNGTERRVHRVTSYRFFSSIVLIG